MITDTGGPAPPGSSERGLIVMSSQLHEHLQRQHSAANCLPHESFVCRRQRTRYREPKSCSGTIRRAKGGLNSKLRAVLRRCAVQKRRTAAFVLSLRDYLGRAEPKRSVADRTRAGYVRSLGSEEIGIT